MTLHKIISTKQVDGEKEKESLTVQCKKRRHGK